MGRAQIRAHGSSPPRQFVAALTGVGPGGRWLDTSATSTTEVGIRGRKRADLIERGQNTPGFLRRWNGAHP